MNNWGITPIELVAPLGLLALIFICRRLSRGGPGKDRDIGGIVLLVLIIVASCALIYAGLVGLGLVQGISW